MLGNRRRGAGAIIGAAFVLLIIISGYSLYAFQAATWSSSQTVFADMNRRDRERNEETLRFNSLAKYPSNRVKFNVTNTTPLAIHLIQVGVFDRSVVPETQTYTAVDIYVSAGETFVSPDSAPIPSTTSGEFLLQLVSERGNLYDAVYPPPPSVIEMIESFSTSTTGAATLSFQSVEWAYRNPRNQVTGLTFASGWQVSRTQYLCWRVSVKNNGATPLAVNSITSFSFQRSGTATFRIFYVVYNQGTDAAPSLITYGGANTVTVASGATQTLYFAVSSAGGNPSLTGTADNLATAAQYTGFLLLYDTNSGNGQTLQYIAIDAV